MTKILAVAVFCATSAANATTLDWSGIITAGTFTPAVGLSSTLFAPGTAINGTISFTSLPVQDNGATIQQAGYSEFTPPDTWDTLLNITATWAGGSYANDVAAPGAGENGQNSGGVSSFGDHALGPFMVDQFGVEATQQVSTNSFVVEERREFHILLSSFDTAASGNVGPGGLINITDLASYINPILNVANAQTNEGNLYSYTQGVGTTQVQFVLTSLGAGIDNPGGGGDQGGGGGGAALPEPASLALLGLGLAALPLSRRARRR